MSSHHSALARQVRTPGKLRSRSAGQRHKINQVIGNCLPDDASQRAEFLGFLAIVQSRSNILELSSVRLLPICRDYEGLVKQLFKVFELLVLAVRPLHQWQPPTCESGASVVVQYRSLLLHLFANYDVPEYLTMSPSKFDLLALINIGRGTSLRTAFPDFPLPKSVARSIWRVPHHIRDLEAIHWASVVALGGSESLANIVCRANWILNHSLDRFVTSVAKFLIRAEKNADKNPSEYPCFSNGEVQQILDFVRTMKFDQPHTMLGYQANTDEPLMPTLDLDGKGLRWIRRLMANWRHEIELPPPKFNLNPNHFQWDRSAIAEFNWNDGDDEWTIRELCTTRALISEGMIMHHCVATYDQICFKEYSTIWSVRRHHVEGETKVTKRMATIEVDSFSNHIDQVRGKYNQQPNQRVTNCIKVWAEDQKLMFDEDGLA